MKIALKYFAVSLLLSSTVGAQEPKNDLEGFKKALEQFRAAKHEESIASFESALKDKSNLEERI